MNCDPDCRDRRETERIVRVLVADYLKVKRVEAVATGLNGKSSENRRFDQHSWFAVSPHSGVGLQLQIGVQTYGCSHFRKDFVGCLNCGLSTAAAARLVTADEIITQIDSALNACSSALDQINRVCIQGDGSFLSPAEVPREAAYAVAKRLKSLSQVRTIMMETRLDLVERDLSHILRVRSILMPDKRLEVALGLESASEFIRNVVFRKGSSRKCDIEKILCILADSDIDVLLYVFIKPALLTEAEAVFDAIRTVRFVHSIAASKPRVHWTAALQPSFVQPNTFLAWLYAKGAFVTPFLWSVEEIIRRSAAGPALVHLGSPEDYPAPIATAANRTGDGAICECTPTFYSALLDYNRHRSVDRLVRELPACGCRSVWVDEINGADFTSVPLGQKTRYAQLTGYEEATNTNGDGRSPAFA